MKFIKLSCCVLQPSDQEPWDEIPFESEVPRHATRQHAIVNGHREVNVERLFQLLSL